MIYTSITDYRSEIKRMIRDNYEFAMSDAYTEVYDKVEAMKRANAALRYGKGYDVAVKQIKSMVDNWFNWSGVNYGQNRRNQTVRRRMKNADLEIDAFIKAAISKGILRPKVSQQDEGVRAS